MIICSLEILVELNFINQETSVKKVFYILSKYFCIKLNTKCN